MGEITKKTSISREKEWLEDETSPWNGPWDPGDILIFGGVDSMTILLCSFIWCPSAPDNWPSRFFVVNRVPYI